MSTVTALSQLAKDSADHLARSTDPDVTATAVGVFAVVLVLVAAVSVAGQGGLDLEIARQAFRRGFSALRTATLLFAIAALLAVALVRIQS